jgi:predicted transcriptional regulator
MNHFIELEQKGMINRSSSSGGLISITRKGKKFIEQYDELINLIEIKTTVIFIEKQK